MSAVHLPPAQPPADDVDALLVQLRIARDSLDIAQERTDRVRQWAAEPDLTWPEDTTLRILLQARTLELELWGREVHQLTERGRAMGLAL